MKIKISLIILLLTVTAGSITAQIIYSSKVDSIQNLVSSTSIANFNKELSGEVPVTVGGSTYRIYSRKYNSQMNPIAAQYIYEKLQGFGLETRYQNNSATSVNVIGKKTGTKYPNKYYIICGHYDNITQAPSDTVYGADDNASGVCGVLETARLISSLNFEYSVYFIAFDEEEIGLYGSRAYADTAYARGDTIMGVLNLDMISYDGNNDMKFKAIVNPQSVDLADDFLSANQIYNIGLAPVKIVDASSSGSDHWYFWQRGYKAFFGIEDDFNPYYHTINDRYNKINQPYFTKAIKTSLAAFLSWGLGLKTVLIHGGITTGSDTSARTAVLEYMLPFKIAAGQNQPRLYYKINSGLYQYVTPFLTTENTLKFLIPGQQAGTKVSYYFALQDSTSTNVVTLPAGGSGINPPGTTPPNGYYSYYITTGMSQCSNSPVKNIPDVSILYDTINVNVTGKVSNIKINLNINHPNDGELLISIKSPSNGTATLSTYNGNGGANFTNTTFDDSALVSIVNGVPPYTGSYKPQNPFTSLLNSDINGGWIMRIYDKAAGNQGTLLNWCILLKYYVYISVEEDVENLSFNLNQNYPNPFNPTTRIGFRIGKKDNVTLKIYDQLGREIQTLINDVLTSGEYEILWNAKNYPSGVYYYKIESNGRSETKRMLLAK